MYLQSAYLQNVRNLSVTDLRLGPGFNFVYGDNGAGKTALLEALHILSRGRSFRTHKIAPVISHGEGDLLVRGSLCNSMDPGAPPDQTIAIRKSRTGETAIRVGGETRHKISDLAKLLPLQVLLPDSSQLVFGNPGGRRGFIDWGLFHVEQHFLVLYGRYRRVLTQRNAWLKSMAQSVGFDDDPWLQQLLPLSIEISTMRQRYVEALLPHIKQLLSRLDVGARVHLDYDWGGLNSADEAEKRLVESMSRDVKFGTTHRGPHRGDLLVSADDHHAAEVLSRGQAKLVAGACIIAQAKYLQECAGTRSIFLVDDFAAELDPGHWEVFLDTLVDLGGQVIATGTSALDKDTRNYGGKDPVVFHVEHGSISQTV